MNSQISSINNNNILNNNKKFYAKSTKIEKTHRKLSVAEKTGIFATTTAGILTSLAIIGKATKNPMTFKNIFKKPFKESFFGKLDYGVKNVLAIGAGSCIGGYTGGILFDKNKNNRQAKKREALIQYTNISFPIVTVALFSKIGNFVMNKLPKSFIQSNSKPAKVVKTASEIIFPTAGLFAGIYAGNRAANKINQKIFKSDDNRPVNIKDFSAHIDDVCLTAKYIAPKSVIANGVSRIIPLALMVSGNEIGRKQETKKIN